MMRVVMRVVIFLSAGGKGSFAGNKYTEVLASPWHTWVSQSLKGEGKLAWSMKQLSLLYNHRAARPLAHNTQILLPT